MHGRPALDFASPAGCEQMVTESTHIDEGVLDLVLIDVYDIVEVRVGSPFGTSDHCAIFTDVVLEQLIIQEASLKNSGNWEQVIEDIKGLNCNEIIRFSYPVSPLNEALLRVIRNLAPKRTIVARARSKP